MGQASGYVTCEAYEDTERAYRIEGALWQDESGAWLEDAEIQDADGRALTQDELLAIPGGHAETIATAWEDIALDS